MQIKNESEQQLPGPMLIMVMGLPGSGKTYFARAFSNQIGAVHMNSDGLRKELNKNPGYSLNDKEAVYKRLHLNVTEALIKGECVVVDATFSRKQYRQPYFDFAKNNNISHFVIYVEANEEIIKGRLKKKRPDSDADLAVYKIIKAEYEDLKIAHLKLQSDNNSLDEMIHSTLDYIKGE